MLLFLLVAPALAIDGAFDCAAWTAPADAWPTAAALDLDDSRYGALASGVYSGPFVDVLDVITAYSEPGCPYYDDAGDVVDEAGEHSLDTSCTTAAGDSIEWYRVPQDGYETGTTYGEWVVTIRPASGARTTSWTLTQGTQVLTVDGDEGDTCSVEGAEATLDGGTATVEAEGWTPLTDRDGDGYCVEVDDCRDIQARVHPGARDIPYDGVDQDCDGLDTVDIDHDGHSALAAGGDDCDDFRATVHPGAWDRPHDGFDQDCDGVR